MTSEAGEGLQPAERPRRIRVLEFSSAATEEVARLTKAYQKQLEKQSGQIARRKRLDAVSRVHVQLAAGDLWDQVEPKRFRVFRDLGALAGGAGLATLLGLFAAHAKLDAEAGFIVGGPLAAGIISYMYGYAGTQ